VRAEVVRAVLAADAAEKAAAAAAEVWERAAASLSRGEADVSEAACARAAAAKEAAAAQRAAAARKLSQQVACAEWWRAEAGVSATEDEQAWERYRPACKGSASKTPFPWLRAPLPHPKKEEKINKHKVFLERLHGLIILTRSWCVRAWLLAFIWKKVRQCAQRPRKRRHWLAGGHGGGVGGGGGRWPSRVSDRPRYAN
jgi:hypothetical protein